MCSRVQDNCVAATSDKLARQCTSLAKSAPEQLSVVHSMCWWKALVPNQHTYIYTVLCVGDPLVKEDEVFSSEVDRLTGVLKERVSLYEEEEHALRVMVREEVEERMLAGELGREGGREGGGWDKREKEEEKEGGSGRWEAGRKGEEDHN